MIKHDIEGRVCTRCVMDTSDPCISFNEKGVCNHCLEFDSITSKNWFPNEEGEAKLSEIIGCIKRAGAGKKYDCILGLSGGVDSSYLALKSLEWGLRPLLLHVDAGWNSDIATANISSIVNYCNYEFYTERVNWEDMRTLQLAYLRSGIPNQDVPQDHIFFSTLYHFATKNDIRYVLSGGNIATESIFPKSWHGSAMDAINLKAIQKRYGDRELSDYKTISFFEYYIWYPLVKGMRTIRPLNFMHYDKRVALEILENVVGYKQYGRKHGESRFTKLFQNYYLPVRFGFDKRRPHLSSLIVSGQLTRAEAIELLQEPLYNHDELEEDIEFVSSKLEITRQEFDELMRAPLHAHDDFPTWGRRYKLLKGAQSFIAAITGKRLGVYS